jgi:hypothetical protein
MYINAHGERLVRRSISHDHRRGINRLTARIRAHKVEQAISMPKTPLNLNCQRAMTFLFNFLFKKD